MTYLVRITLLIAIALACLMPVIAQTGSSTSVSSDRQAQKQAARDRKEAERRRKEEEKRAQQQAGVRCSRLYAKH